MTKQITPPTAARINPIKTKNFHWIASFLIAIAFLVVAPRAAWSQAGSGTKAADKIVERVESQETSSSAQEKLVKEISETAKQAGKKFPNDADEVKRIVKAKLDEIRDRQSTPAKPGGKNNKEIREWVKKLKRELMDGGYFTFTSAPAQPGAEKGERIAERVEAEKTTSSDQETLTEEIAAAARQAGTDHPNDKQAVKDAVKEKLDEIRDRPSTPGKPGGKNNKEVKDWIKGLKRTLMQSSYVSAVPPAGSRLLLTGTVVADREATLSVVDATGQTLEGVVVEIDDEEYVSDRNGRVVFTVAAGAATLAAVLPELRGETPPVRAAVVEAVAPLETPQVPTIDNAPRYITAGETVKVSGSGFDGVAPGNTVEIGGQPVHVLASSPNELIVTAPQPEKYGSQPLTVATADGMSQAHDVSMIGIRLESSDTSLRRGQKGKGRIVVVGTNDRIRLRVENLVPNTVSLRGGDAIEVRTSGGRNNAAKIQFTARNPGRFQIRAEVLDRHSESRR